MIDPKTEVVEDESQESSFSKIKFLLIYCSIFFLTPSAVGIPLTAVLRNGTYVEALYVIFGAISLLLGMVRGWNRDSKNFRKYHTTVEDKESASYRQFFFIQMTSYIVGLILLGISVGAFYICEAAGIFNPF